MNINKGFVCGCLTIFALSMGCTNQEKGRSVEPKIVTETLAYPELDAVNSIAFPSKISTKIAEQPWNTKANRITLAAQSFTVIKFKLN